MIKDKLDFSGGRKIAEMQCSIKQKNCPIARGEKIMSEDITFCFSECDMKRCIRNKKNIKHPEILHSFAFLEMTEDCLKSSIKNEGEKI